MKNNNETIHINRKYIKVISFQNKSPDALVDFYRKAEKYSDSLPVFVLYSQRELKITDKIALEEKIKSTDNDINPF